MSLEAIGAVHVSQAAADAAAQRLAVALENDRPFTGATPADIERGHAQVAEARAAFEQADAAVGASQAITAPGGLVV